MIRKITRTLLATVCFSLLSNFGVAEDLFVNPAATSGAQNGSSFADGFLTIADAVQEANTSVPNTTIHLTPDVFLPPSTLTVTDECLIVGDPLGGTTILTSACTPTFDIQNTDIHFFDVHFAGPSRVLEATGGKISFERCVITGTGGTFSSNLGAIQVRNAERLMIKECLVEANHHLGSGGAVLANNCWEVQIEESSFHNNGSQQNGGAAALINCNRVRVHFSTFTGNQTNRSGAGLYIENMDPAADTRITHTRLASNSAAGHGGGLYLISGGTCEMVNCVIQKNVIYGSGGGILARGPGLILDVVNCTIVDNFANSGAGIWHLSWANHLRIVNSILWGNRAMKPNLLEQQLAFPPTMIGHSCVEDWGSISAYVGFAMINLNPRLRADGSPRLLSPCIDAGNTAACTELEDIIKNPRVVGSSIEMGAYEVKSPFILRKDPLLSFGVK